MRSLIISIILFTSVIACIILNVGYIHNTADRIEAISADLEMPTDEKLTELEEFWEKNDGFLGLSISTAYLDGIEETIVSLRCAYELGNLEEFEKQRALLFDAADDIRALERFSVENIF